MPFFVVRLVLQDDLAVAIDRDAIVRVGQIFGREPEIERMFAHQIECPFRRDFWRAGFERVAVELADKRDVAHGKFPFRRAEVEIVNRKCFLKDSRVWTFRQRHQNGIHVTHVMPADDVRAVGEAVRMFVISRTQAATRQN